jgi:single-strand DNA-binding protein
MFNRSVNKVVLIGNLGKEPEIRYTQAGVTVANLTIATTESWKDKSTGERQESTEWHRLSVFNRLGDMCAQYLKKGNKIYVEGRLKTSKWKAQDGSDRYTTEIIVSDIELLDAKNSNSFVASNPSQVNPAPVISAPTSVAAASNDTKSTQMGVGNSSYSSVDFDDDIPF